MKTMLELLIRLHEMRCCYERAERNAQLTPGEKAAVCVHKQLVRECLSPEVLKHYDRMKTTERALRGCPAVFAMAVLVSTYRSLTPTGQGKLAAHFATLSRAPSLNGRTGTIKRFSGGRRRVRIPTARGGKP